MDGEIAAEHRPPTAPEGFVTRPALSPGASTPALTSEPPSPRHWRLLFPLAVLFALGAAGSWYWWVNRNLARTDDAQITAHIHQISPQIDGRVVAILVRDNQHVMAGQKLVVIDPRPERVALDQALAQRASAQAQLDEAKGNLALRQAGLDQARANVGVAKADLFAAQTTYSRYRRVNPGAITAKEIDDAKAAWQSARARLAAAEQGVSGAAAQLIVAKAQLSAAAAALDAAKVAIEKAKLDLSYTTITAPAAGRVTQRVVEIGNVVKEGTVMMAVVGDHVWVTADFKETELARMRPGQRVDIRVDAYPGVVFHGRVDSFQRGTGATFAAIPVENATGNYVKVVQRLPVKIVFDDPRVKLYPLAPGLSVEPSVHLH